MSTRFHCVASLIALTAGLTAFTAERDQDPAPESDSARAETALAEMDWLAGHWSGDIWGGRFHAYYSTPEGGKILSHSRLMRGEDEAFFEFEVFEVRANLVHLQPFPGGKKAMGFQLTEVDLETRKATFENPNKDFPTHMVYHRVSEDELVITLSDPHGGSEKVERFELSR